MNRVSKVEILDAEVEPLAWEGEILGEEEEEEITDAEAPGGEGAGR